MREPALAMGMSMAGVVVRPSFAASTEAGPGKVRSAEPQEKRMRPMSCGVRFGVFQAGVGGGEAEVGDCFILGGVTALEDAGGLFDGGGGAAGAGFEVERW